MSKRPLSGAQRQARYYAKQRARNDQLAAEVTVLRKRLARLKPPKKRRSQ